MQDKFEEQVTETGDRQRTVDEKLSKLRKDLSHSIAENKQLIEA